MQNQDKRVMQPAVRLESPWRASAAARCNARLRSEDGSHRDAHCSSDQENTLDAICKLFPPVRRTFTLGDLRSPDAVRRNGHRK
jgi:hypothetical protein